MDRTDNESDGFSRGELDRVIRRAVELQFESGSESKAPAQIDEGEIRRIGAEVGIEDRFLQQAIGEVKADHLLSEVPSDSGALARWVGDRFVRTQRVAPGTVDEIDSRLEQHLRVAETLSPVRHRRGRSLWHPEEGIAAQLRRSFRWGGYRYELATLSSLEVGVVPMEEGFVLVSLVADLKRSRNEATLGGTLGAGVPLAVVGVGLGFLLGSPWLVIPTGLAAAAAGGLGGLRLARLPFRNRREKVLLALEGILDKLETGQPLQRRIPDRRRARHRLLGGQ